MLTNSEKSRIKNILLVHALSYAKLSMHVIKTVDSHNQSLNKTTKIFQIHEYIT